MSQPYACGCEITYEPAPWPKGGAYRIQYCPIHQAASEMLTMLRAMRAAFQEESIAALEIKALIDHIDHDIRLQEERHDVSS
jgi:hypothetical protein